MSVEKMFRIPLGYDYLLLTEEEAQALYDGLKKIFGQGQHPSDIPLKRVDPFNPSPHDPLGQRAFTPPTVKPTDIFGNPIVWC